MTGLVKYTGALLALAICSACAGPAGAPSTVAPSLRYVGRTLWVNGRPVTAARINPLPGYAALVPDARATSKRFEYIFNNYGTYASIFDYPKSDAQIGSIPGAGGQGCTNVLYGYGKKTFWNVGGATQITKYQVPDKPLKTLSVSYTFPSGCAMDTSGDLAVGILYGRTTRGDGGEVVIFKNGSGSGTAYTTPLDEVFFDGYDNQGNLFADGFTGYRYGFALVELPKGGSKFQTITLSNSVQFPGSVQWDGKYLTVEDQDAYTIYRYTVNGTTATLKGTVSLSGEVDCAQTWIAKGVVFCADSSYSDGKVFKYPAGGAAIATLTGNFDLPLGVVAAQK